ncbi:BnaA05g16750D [Brassica napus]|uniref:BnaA05g16750D protein n=1 Tax=Brassica napus TaxID=3708 RepID=A0A078FCF8_BRANA|nr:BnaA05g16750D [Brassica napus]
MRNCKKRPRRPTRSQGRPSRDLFYQTLTDYSDEETQGILEFMKKLKQADDETCIFNRFCCGIDSYRYGCINYISLKNRLLWILRDHKGLLDEFHQLKSGFASPVIRNNEKKKENAESDMERTVLVEQLDEILRDHTPLKEEFETFLVDSRLLKRKREESVEDTPSYQIRPEAEVRSSSNGVFNEKYYLVSPYDPEVASQNEHQRCLDKKRNNLEGKLMKEDMLMGDLDAVIRFGKDPKLFEKPPLGFDRVLDWFCGGKEVPQKYKTHPKLAATYMLPIMQITLEEMTRAKTVKAISANESEGEVK